MGQKRMNNGCVEKLGGLCDDDNQRRDNQTYSSASHHFSEVFLTSPRGSSSRLEKSEKIDETKVSNRQGKKIDERIESEKKEIRRIGTQEESQYNRNKRDDDNERKIDTKCYNRMCMNSAWFSPAPFCALL